MKLSHLFITLILNVMVSFSSAKNKAPTKFRSNVTATIVDFQTNIQDFENAMANRRFPRSNQKQAWNIRPVRFYAMGDVPYSPYERENLPNQLKLLDPTVDFTIHLGDMQFRTPLCKEEPYQKVASILKASPIPTFIIPGDNCYYDCSNWRQGFQYWTRELLYLEQNWAITKFNVRRQAVRPENFSITIQRVLFIGIHTLWTRTIKDPIHWKKLQTDNINWTRNQMIGFAHSGLVDAVVILSQAYTRPELYPEYFDYLSDEAASLPDMPFLFLQGDEHRFLQDTPFRAKNILRTVVDRGGLADPLLITVDTTLMNPFVMTRRPLTGR